MRYQSFNSRLREEATAGPVTNYYIITSFNSRLREEATLIMLRSPLLLRSFNSRLREEATTETKKTTLKQRHVSTHASVRRRLGSDPLKLVAAAVSTHASVRRRLEQVGDIVRSVQVSTHASVRRRQGDYTATENKSEGTFFRETECPQILFEYAEWKGILHLYTTFLIFCRASIFNVLNINNFKINTQLSIFTTRKRPRQREPCSTATISPRSR